MKIQRFALPAMIFFLFFATLAAAQVKTVDVVYLKNGSIIRGTIVEMMPGKSVKLQTRDGNVMVYEMSEVDKTAKEEMSPADAAGSTQDTPAGEESSNIESWYLYFAIGYGHADYPDQLQSDIDFLTANSSSHAAISIDIPGVYWPLGNRKTIIGGVINGIGDRYEFGSNSIQINQYSLAFSTLHFLNREIGEGFFLRGDLGFSSIRVESSSGISSNSETGVGILLGGGYSIPLSTETRLLLNLNYGSRRVEGDTWGALGINVGILL